MSRLVVVALFAVSLVTGLTAAPQPGAVHGPDDAALAQETQRVAGKLMAPCCYSQQASVHQSDAAEEVRQDVRARLVRGESDAQILDAYVTRFGKRILAEPPAVGFDLALYVFPVIVFGLSLTGVAMILRRFSHHPQDEALRATALKAVHDDPGSLQQKLDEALRDLD